MAWGRRGPPRPDTSPILTWWPVESTRFADRLRIVPERPGVYLMKDSRGAVLYVGKAARLRDRLRSYFGSPVNLPEKVQRMVRRVADFEFIVTDSEAEALILECTLIKRFRPPYNARLKDDKSYPYLKIDLREDFPQVLITRRVEPDGARYFGPFATTWTVRRTLETLKRLFPYRSCTKPITGTDPRPCLDYYIHRCIGPCIGAASREQYHQVIQQVILFLEGKTDEVVAELRRRMEQAAERLEFEHAAVLRDQVHAIERVIEEQKIKVSSLSGEDMDVLALAQGRGETWVEVFFVRNGKLIGRDHFRMENTEDDAPAAVLASFVIQFYTSASYVPPTILTQEPLEERELIAGWLAQKRGAPVTLECPAEGARLELVQMVAENAREALEQMKAQRLAREDQVGQALAELQEALDLPRPPRRIECYDVSNIQGSSAVASMVVFEDGKPRPAHYRRFQIKEVAGVDDYRMMQEVLRRRFKRLAAALGKDGEQGEGQGEAWSLAPDLVLIDGGKGHLAAAQQVFLDLGLHAVPLASIAKENEWLFVPHAAEPVVLPRASPGLFLVQRVRDEAHRFAITYHRKVRSRSALRSGLDAVPGIGPKRKRMLLRRFGSLQGIKEASLEELSAAPGMTLALARRVKELL